MSNKSLPYHTIICANKEIYYYYYYYKGFTRDIFSSLGNIPVVNV